MLSIVQQCFAWLLVCSLIARGFISLGHNASGIIGSRRSQDHFALFGYIAIGGIILGFVGIGITLLIQILLD